MNLEIMLYQPPTKLELELGLGFTFLVRWVGGWRSLNLEIMLNQPPIKLELELGLSLAIFAKI